MIFSVRLRNFRNEKGYSQKDLAFILGISKITLVRWENGTSKPSNLAAQQLEELGLGKIERHETKIISTPRLSLHDEKNVKLRDAIQNKIRIGNKNFKFEPSPYVINGPEDQLNLFIELYKIQELQTDPTNVQRYLRSLSAISFFNDTDFKTSQFELEQPKSTAKHWNTNYGSHGWHRYVGRFPSHLVRAIMNYFNVKPGNLICDPFVGSGTTLVECRLLGLKGIGIDLCPLSTQISRTKSKFPTSISDLENLYEAYTNFYNKKIHSFLKGKCIRDISYKQITSRSRNLIGEFPNYEKWLTPEAYLGASLTVEFINNLKGYNRDFISCALSSAMRSIGNVDVDVVRAEYSKKPRVNVDVLSLVQRKIRKMILDTKKMITTHSDLLSKPDDINVITSSLLDVKMENESVDHIITSPPYGVESISYLRTHLLSYRCLYPILNYDPYENDNKFIGSEYLNEYDRTGENWGAEDYSKTFKDFFVSLSKQDLHSKLSQRKNMMMNFFSEMVLVVQKFHQWLRKNGKVAFVIGNKRIDNYVIPTDKIISEIFESNGFKKLKTIEHKLKCNNSNSEVPWQEKIIQDEFVLIFEKRL